MNKYKIIIFIIAVVLIMTGGKILYCISNNFVAELKQTTETMRQKDYSLQYIEEQKQK